MTSAVSAAKGRRESDRGHGALDRDAFLRPIAHRGLHSRAKSRIERRIENTAPAFRAAVDKGYGIECDLQAAKDGTPMVFHDEKLDRLVEASGSIAAHTPGGLANLRYKGQYTTILTFAELLELVAGRVPLLVEVKRNKHLPPKAFLESIARQASTYRGPIALMSFDGGVVAALGRLAPGVSRGWIVGSHALVARWWAATSTARKDAVIARALAAAPDGISFLSVDVRLLRGVRKWLDSHAPELTLFCWTVRTKRQSATAARWADAPTFEGYEP